MASSFAIPTNKPSNRLVGDMPAIGIRPTIDARERGVRESLEKQTMNMAMRVARLLEENIHHPNGLPVRCVIADTTIGRVAEAARCAEKFAREGVGLSITVTPCWCYGAETMDMDPAIPKAVWGFNGTERPGAVYLAAVLAGHAQKGLPAFGIYGRDVQEASDTTIPADVKEKLLQFARAGLAVATMKGKSYLAMGGTSMGIAGSIVDPGFLESYLGMRSESVDMSEFTRRIEEEIYDKQELERALPWIKAYCQEGPDTNDPATRHDRKRKDWEWEFVAKMTLVARDLMVGNARLKELGFGEESLGHNAIASGFQGQRQWNDHFPNGDFLETVLNSSFDWSGIREAFVVATENDYLNGITMLFGHLLTGTAQILSDVRTYWSPDAVKRVTGKRLTGDAAGGIIHLINSGSTCMDGTGQQKRGGRPVMKPFWEISKEEVERCLKATHFCPADLGYFRGGGFSSEFETLGAMPVTMARINVARGLGPFLQIAEGQTVALPPAVGKPLMQRTNPTWPTTWFVPNVTGSGSFRDVYSVMNAWGANHGAISYGHIGSELITLAAMLRIPVAMHNVAEERIFRPKAWGAFGEVASEGADYRACRSFGPLYGSR
jgi:L-fucose isomerase